MFQYIPNTGSVYDNPIPGLIGRIMHQKNGIHISDISVSKKYILVTQMSYR